MQHSPMSAEKPLILVVDDVAAICSVCQEILSPTYGAIVCATTDVEAIKVFRLYDTLVLLLSDLRIGKASGVRLANILRRFKPSLKIVFMTGRGSDPLSEQAKLIGPLIMKPFGREQLLTIIKSILPPPSP